MIIIFFLFLISCADKNKGNINFNFDKNMDKNDYKNKIIKYGIGSEFPDINKWINKI